jgi:hypothetical protein
MFTMNIYYKGLSQHVRNETFLRLHHDKNDIDCYNIIKKLLDSIFDIQWE